MRESAKISESGRYHPPPFPLGRNSPPPIYLTVLILLDACAHVRILRALSSFCLSASLSAISPDAARPQMTDIPT